MDDFVKTYKLEALEEIADHLSSIEELTQSLQSPDSPSDHLDALFRAFHSIKGIAGSAEFHSLSQLAHKFEDLITALKNDPMRKPQVLSALDAYLGDMGAALQGLGENFEFVGEFEKSYDILNQSVNSIPSSKDSLLFLVVDDEPDVVDVLNHLVSTEFSSEGELVGDGYCAQEKAQDKKFDFIITDYRMPVMNGLDFIKSIRETDGPNQTTPIILLTAFTPRLSPQQDLWESVFFLEKPLVSDKLIYVIKCCLNLNRKSA